MKVITFDAHLIETSDLQHVHNHIMENAPCAAYYKVVYPPGNTGYFAAAAERDGFLSVSIGETMYNMMVRLAA